MSKILHLLAGAYLVFFGIYAFGEKARRNPKVEALMSTLEGRYSQLNQFLENLTVREGLSFLQKLYGWLTAGLLFISFLLVRFIHPTPSIFFLISTCWGITGIGWFSIKWVIDHKKTVAESSKGNLLIILGPLLLGILDYFTHSTFIQMVSSPLNLFLTALHIPIPNGTNPIIVGGVISLIMILFFGFYYALAWMMAIPAYFISRSMITVPVWFAQRVANADPQNKFLWFAIFLMAVATMYLAWP